MRMTRAIIALLIALSVATLPVAGAAALGQQSAELVLMSESTDAAHDCCPEPGKPCDMDGCKFMSVCALSGFNFSGMIVSEFVFPLTPARAAIFPASEVSQSRTHSPPLHPPQG